VFFDRKENQTESFNETGIVNFPKESDMAYDPEDVCTVTASSLFFAEIIVNSSA
jgi:hypothetical protein